MSKKQKFDAYYTLTLDAAKKAGLKWPELSNVVDMVVENTDDYQTLDELIKS